jgi:glycosyltransferase involved in cell wall biosynthesis
VKTGFKKVVIMPWGSDLTWFPLIVTRFLSRAIEAIELSAHITVNCQHLKNKILEFVPHYPPQKISVIPWGIDPTLFNPSRKDNKFKQDLFKNKIVLISTRAFEPKYKPENIIKAVSLLSRKRDDFGLLLLGGGPLTRKILEMVKKAKLGEKIVYMGEISNEHVAYYLNFSNVYVSFSPIDGTSLCLEEAMMCGLPVIVVNYPSNREWVKDGENGFLFSLNNLDEFVQKISLLMDRNEMREKMGRENYRIAMENFDINKTFSRFLKMLEEVALLKC